MEYLSKPTKLSFEEWADLTRCAAYCLGCLVTMYRKEIPADPAKIQAPTKSLKEDTAHLLAQSSRQQPNANEIVYLIAACQQVLSGADQWHAPAEQPKQPAEQPKQPAEQPKQPAEQPK